MPCTLLPYSAASEFVVLLRNLQSVFGLAQDTVHIYYDLEPGRTVAFNRGVPLFSLCTLLRVTIANRLANINHC